MKRLFNNTVITSVDYAILIALNLLATPILLRHFGIDGYGAFVFLSIFSIYGALSFFDLGMEGSLMNYVARFEADDDRDKLQDTLTSSVVYYAVLGLLLGIGLYFTGDLIARKLLDEQATLSRASVVTSVSIIAVNIFLQFLTIPFAAVLQGLRRFVITKTLNSAMTIVRYVLIIVAAIYYHRIEYAFVIITALTLVRLGVLLVIFRFRLPQFSPMQIRFNPALLRTLFNYSSILFVNRIIGLISNQLPKVLIWLYLAVSNMAIFDVVSRPANLLRLVMSVLNSAIVPEVARLSQLGDIAAIRRMYINLIRYAYLLLLPIVAVMGVYINDLLGAWVGEQFVPYAYMALILLAVYIVLPIPSIASTMVVGLEKVKQTIWIAVVSTVINLILSIVLLKAIGLAGLMVATLCAETFGLIPYLLAMRRFLEFSPWAAVRPLFPIAFFSIIFLGLHVLQRVLLGDLTWVAVLTAALIVTGNYLFNFFYLLSRDEKRFIRERLQVFRGKLIRINGV